MSSVIISSLPELYSFVQIANNYPIGTEVQINGEISQIISKGYNAYSKKASTMYKSKAIGIAAVTSLCFGPAALPLLIGSGLTWAGSFIYQKRADEAYNAIPCAQEVEHLFRLGYELVRNDGSNVILSRTQKKRGLLSAE